MVIGLHWKVLVLITIELIESGPSLMTFLSSSSLVIDCVSVFRLFHVWYGKQVKNYFLFLHVLIAKFCPLDENILKRYWGIQVYYPFD